MLIGRFCLRSRALPWDAPKNSRGKARWKCSLPKTRRARRGRQAGGQACSVWKKSFSSRSSDIYDSKLIFSSCRRNWNQHGTTTIMTIRRRSSVGVTGSGRVGEYTQIFSMNSCISSCVRACWCPTANTSTPPRWSPTRISSKRVFLEYFEWKRQRRKWN